MYAVHHYQPPRTRTAGIGGALAICAVFAAGVSLIAPKLMPADEPTVLIGENIPVPPPPDPEPQPTPKPDARTPRAPLPTAPDPIIEMPVPPIIETTTVIPPSLPPVTIVEKIGPPVVADPPKPAPALVAAAVDPRYARDFQPDYPSQELRAQRDGSVSVRVLIGTDGRVKAVEQVRATSAAFFEATRRQALAKWRFKPATRGGVAQESWKVMNVRFEIENQ